MKIKGLIAVLVLVTLVLVSCSKSAVKSTKVVNKVDSLSYALGLNIYASLKTDSVKVNPMVIAKALMDGEDGKPMMDELIARGFIQSFFNEREMAKRQQMEEQNKVLYKDVIAQSDSFLQKNKEKSGVIVTASGLQYEVVKMGTGPKPTETSTVKVNYTGTFLDGSSFDSSVGKEPAQFQCNGVIRGWTEALLLMPEGSKFRLYIPHTLAYGPSGYGDMIKPYSTLIFDVELLEVVK